MDRSRLSSPRRDLLKQLAPVMPVETQATVPDAVEARLVQLADETLSWRIELIVSAGAPLAPSLQRGCRREA